MDRIEVMARTLHAANREFAACQGDAVPAWDVVPEAVRESVRGAVRLHLEQPGTTPQQNHENFLADRAAQGWSYGPERNAGARVSPFLVPWDQLDAVGRAKNALPGAIVGALSPHL